MQGTLDKCAKELTLLNQIGAGVFITVNKTDGSGKRKAENITDVRALFVDSDTGDLPPLELPPSIIVQSRNGQHGYWLLPSGEPLDSFTSAQKALVHHLGTDPAIHDLPRVMRLPGFIHMKDPNAPFLVRITEMNSALRYTMMSFALSAKLGLIFTDDVGTRSLYSSSRKISISLMG